MSLCHILEEEAVCVFVLVAVENRCQVLKYESIMDKGMCKIPLPPSHSDEHWQTPHYYARPPAPYEIIVIGNMSFSAHTHSELKDEALTDEVLLGLHKPNKVNVGALVRGNVGKGEQKQRFFYFFIFLSEQQQIDLSSFVPQ